MHHGLGKKAKKRRKELGLRQIDVVKEVGICKTSVIRFEKGLIDLPYETVLKLAQVLHMPIRVIA